MGDHMRGPGDERRILPFPTIRVGDVEEPLPGRTRWLVEDLWTSRAAAVLGGPPKSAKTWLGVELALSVASGTPALGRYAVKEPGSVIFFGAEDVQHHLKERFAALCQRKAVPLNSVEVLFLDTPVLRLDEEHDQARLVLTVDQIRPRLLVLDPLVRIHRLQENSSMEISGLLAFLRTLERAYHTAILLLHHTRKSGASTNHPGQALRGSSDIQAWADELFYLDRVPEGLRLIVEHRSAPPRAPIMLRLSGEPTPHFEVLSESATREPGEDSFADEVLWCLAAASRPMRLEELREKLAARKQRVVDALRELMASGSVERTQDGYQASSCNDSDTQ